MKRIVLFLVPLVAAVALAFWWFSPEQVVKRRTNTLLEVLTLDAGSGKSIRQMGGYSLNAMLATEIELESPAIAQANGDFERQDLESAYSWLCEHAKFTRFTMERIHKVEIEGDRAVVTCTLEGIVELNDIRPADGRYDTTFTWAREDDGWRLARAVWDLAEQ